MVYLEMWKCGNVEISKVPHFQISKFSYGPPESRVRVLVELPHALRDRSEQSGEGPDGRPRLPRDERGSVPRPQRRDYPPAFPGRRTRARPRLQGASREGTLAARQHAPRLPGAPERTRNLVDR